MASSATHLFLVLSFVLTVTVVAAMPPMPFYRTLHAPLFLNYMRPRRAPPMSRPPVGPTVGMASSGYPSRTLTFSGYFSGAGAPQNADPFAFSWGPSVRSANAEEPVPVEAPPARQEPLDETPDNPPVVDVPVDGVYDSVESRAKPEPNKPYRPSYPVPESPASSSPSSAGGDGAQPLPSGPPSQSHGNREPEDNGGDRGDRGGYGTINAYFPFMFGGGWPSGGPEGPRQSSPRGYGAPSPPNGPPSGAPSGPSPANPPEGHGGQQAGGSGSGYRGSPYYPVAIANSFSTGRNAMASSTATAYGGSPSRS